MNKLWCGFLYVIFVASATVCAEKVFEDIENIENCKKNHRLINIEMFTLLIRESEYFDLVQK